MIVWIAWNFDSYFRVVKETPCIKIPSNGFTELWKSILHTSELELLRKLIEENTYNFCKQFSEIVFTEWFSKNFGKISIKN